MALPLPSRLDLNVSQRTRAGGDTPVSTAGGAFTVSTGGGGAESLLIGAAVGVALVGAVLLFHRRGRA